MDKNELIDALEQSVNNMLANLAYVQHTGDAETEQKLLAEITQFMLDTNPQVAASMYLVLLNKAAEMLRDAVANDTTESTIT